VTKDELIAALEQYPGNMQVYQTDEWSDLSMVPVTRVREVMPVFESGREMVILLGD
jgi:hypothetical protein